MDTYNVFSGAFSDESGQRFLKMMHEMCLRAFTDLYAHSMPNHPERYRGCLDRVCAWEPGVVSTEVRSTLSHYPDMNDLFRHVYIAYVKAMRGGQRMKIMIQLPKIDQFVHKVLENFAKHQCTQDARFFSHAHLLEQRVTCLDAVRDALFTFLDDDHVKLEREPSVVSVARASESLPPIDERKKDASVVSEPASSRGGSFANSQAVGVKSEANVSAARSSIVSAPTLGDDAASRVVSHVFEHEDDDESVLGPDDSVSNVDFADKQHRAIERFSRRNASLQQQIEDESERSSHTSVSLSSISNAAPVPQTMRHAPFGGDDDEGSSVSHHSRSSRRASEISMQQAQRSRRNRSPAKSYITHLTEEDDDV